MTQYRDLFIFRYFLDYVLQTLFLSESNIFLFKIFNIIYKAVRKSLEMEFECFV